MNTKNNIKIITSILRNDFNQILAVTICGFFIRFHGLSAHGFRWDELFILFNAKKPFHSINAITPPPLFPYLIHFFSLFIKNDAFLRVAPAIIGAAMAPVIYVVIRRWHNHEAGLWGAFLIALSPLQIFYSQDLTMYSFLMMESLLALFFWDRLAEDGRFSDYFWYSLVMIAGFQTHPWFAFAFLAQITWLLFFTPVNKPFRMGLYGIITVGLVSTELQPGSFFHFYSPYFSWLDVPSMSDVLRTVQVFLFGIAPPLGSWSPMVLPLSTALLSLSILALASGLIIARGNWTQRMRLLFVGFLGPLVLSFGYSYLVTPVYYADNYALIAYPAFLIIICGALAPPGRWFRLIAQGLGCVYCIVCVITLFFYFTSFEKAPWKNIGLLIDSLPHNRAMDLRSLSPVDQNTLRYYVKKTPEWRGPHFGSIKIVAPDTAEPITLALPIRANVDHDIQNTLPPPWRMKRVVPSSDVVVFILEKHVHTRAADKRARGI